MNINKSVIRAALRSARPLLASRRVSVGGKRALMHALSSMGRSPKGTRYERDVLAGIPVAVVRTSRKSTSGTLIYLHGGAYALGSAHGYRGMVAQLAAAADMTAVIPDYSRVPEARYPVALEEIVALYCQLLADGMDPEHAVIAGDSAGGGLTLAVAMVLRDRGIALPAALGLISPWADLAIDVAGSRPVLRDPLILPSMAAEWAPRYAGIHDPRWPGISPVYGDMAGLPPIVMHTACDDPISIDADKIEAAVAGTATGTLDHSRFDGMWHDFHLQVSVLPEARAAIAELGAKLRNHAATGAADTHINTAEVAAK